MVNYTDNYMFLVVINRERDMVINGAPPLEGLGRSLCFSRVKSMRLV